MQTRNDESESEDTELETKNPIETLVHGFIESRRIHDLQDRIFEFAPVEGQKPHAIFKDKFAEEMTFSTLFFGNPHDDGITKRLSYQNIVKWELLHYSGDFMYLITIYFLNNWNSN